MKNLNYMMDHILYQIFKITSSIPIRRHQTVIDISLKILYLNKIENRIIFRIKASCYLKILTPEMMKLLKSSKNEITKDENSDNVPHLEISKVVLVHCNSFNNDYQQDARVFYTFISNKLFCQLLNISLKKFIF